MKTLIIILMLISNFSLSQVNKYLKERGFYSSGYYVFEHKDSSYTRISKSNDNIQIALDLDSTHNSIDFSIIFSEPKLVEEVTVSISFYDKEDFYDTIYSTHTIPKNGEVYVNIGTFESFAKHLLNFNRQFFVLMKFKYIGDKCYQITKIPISYFEGNYAYIPLLD